MPGPIWFGRRQGERRATRNADKRVRVSAGPLNSDVGTSFAIALTAIRRVRPVLPFTPTECTMSANLLRSAADSHAPTLLFRLALAHRRCGDTQDADELFRRAQRVLMEKYVNEILRDRCAG